MSVHRCIKNNESLPKSNEATFELNIDGYAGAGGWPDDPEPTPLRGPRHQHQAGAGRQVEAGCRHLQIDETVMMIIRMMVMMM